MTCDPLQISNKAKNNNLTYSLLRGIQINPPKNLHSNYIDSIVNDNTFISSYSKSYHTKQQTKRVEAIYQIQKWFKKIKYKNDDNKENFNENLNQEQQKYQEIIEKLIKNQAAIKIQKFFKKNIKRTRWSSQKKVESSKKIKEKISKILSELQNNKEEIYDYEIWDEKISKKTMNFFFYQNQFLKQENKMIKNQL